MKKLIASSCAAILIIGGIVVEANDIAEIDKNFRTATVGNLKVNYFNALKKPFEVTGFAWRKEGEALYRLPSNFTEQEINRGALSLAYHTSGGAIRFQTDSPYLTLRANYNPFSDMNHMPRTGSAGFDLYAIGSDGKEVYLHTIQPGRNNQNYTLEQRFKNITGGKMRCYTLYLPLYSGVKDLEIGVKPGSRILPPPPQKVEKPILFYGSSITQGGCASRPANNYTTMLCRAVDAPQINLGFSGSAMGEIAVAQAIAKLKLAAFVLDYDYNAPHDEHLRRTHEIFFKTVRQANPDLPIIILSGRISHSRREIIKKTYDNAIAAGDAKVWFVDGFNLFGEAGENMCTVDRTHPNDLGFYMMYRHVLPVLRQALGM